MVITIDKAYLEEYMKRLALGCLLLILVTTVSGQRNEVFSNRIASLQVMAGDRWMALPIVQLNGSEPICIDFDDLTHEYHRYTYKVEHCEADWTVSEELFPNDYISGFTEGNTIDDYRESLNTNILYTHYALRIPNDRCRIKMSGNYKLTVMDENNDYEPMFTACFMVYEPLMGVQMTVSSNTDIDINNAHQQVAATVNYGGQTVVVPQEQIKTVVMQNRRWDNAKINAQPQYVMNNGLQWLHCRDLIFPAGNEYRKFEVLDVDHPTMGIDRIEWDGQHFHAFPFLDEPRNNYVYDEDANGAFLIRNSDNVDIHTLSDYVMVHYTLACPTPVAGDVYINNAWTNDRFLPEYKMSYNEETKCYEAVLMQKLGYYSYQYLLMRPDGTLRTMPTEGDFYQTENSYQMLVYFKGQGDRTDKLVGYQEVIYK